ncbi:MAG: hypothetical protein ACJ0RQ_06665 [Candidatus Azotimanducaceae bacterium]
MSEEDLLSQEEKDALIKGVESGDVDTETPEGDGEARAYNFASRDLRLLESLPRLQTVSELFTVAATEAIAKMFRSEPVVVSEPMSTSRPAGFYREPAVPVQSVGLQYEAPAGPVALCP